MDAIEGHPIPQDITGFQFKLIGDMTVKQFAYLAFGLVLGWIFISIPAPLIIKLPLALIPASIGPFLAFIPIHGRPSDTMLMLFIKAIFRPNEYVYHKPVQQEQAETTVIKASALAQAAVTPHEAVKTQHYGPQITKVVSIEDLGKEFSKEDAKLTLPQAQQEQAVVEETVTKLSGALESAKKEEVSHPDTSQAHDKAAKLEQELQEALLQKQALEKKLLELQQQMQQPPAPQHPTPPVGSPAAVSPPPPAPAQVKVKKIPDSLKKSISAPFTPDVPNLITGVIKDARGNVLPNVLVEVKDKDDNPVRAFKTNALGQFASATPLLNGVYTITFEDSKKQQKFDTIELTANGSILNPLEIISVDSREELRKSLFTN